MMRLIVLFAFILTAGISCTTGPKMAAAEKTDSSVTPKLFGRFAIIQGPTSDKEALFNVLVPRLTNYTYDVIDESGKVMAVEKYETVKVPIVFYKVDKIIVKGLQPNKTYTLTVVNKFRGKTSIQDQRTFQALDISKPIANFATASCMADDWRFESIIDPMWARLKQQNADFILLNGDIVYVDSFDFVERQKATETDLWMRYIDTLMRIPLYHWLELKPIFATWDDHDFGTNDSDKTFISKNQARKLFTALFGGKALADGVWQPGPTGVTSEFRAFGQRFYLMDDRTARQPNKNQKVQDPYGHWGQQQHKWLMKSLKASNTPVWIFNGNQIFNGKSLGFKENFAENHPAHFSTFIKELKALPAPVIFSSGDIHLTEIMKIPKETLGYETFEITSSSMHSYIGSGWENPMRLPESYVKEYNFVMVKSEAQVNGVKLNVRSVGIPSKDYFDLNLSVAK